MAEVEDFELDVEELAGLIDADAAESSHAEASNEVAAVTEGDGEDRERKRSREEKKRKKEKRDKKDKKHKKEKRHRSSKFVDDAAGDSEESEDELEDGDAELKDGVGEDLSYIHNHKRSRHLFREGDEEKSVEEIAREIEERNQLHKLRQQVVAGKKHTGGQASIIPAAAAAALMNPEGRLVPLRVPASKRFSPAFLPRPTDPKVFAIKCKPGMARILVARLVNKCYHYRIGRNDENKKVDLGIISVFALDHVKEYIYVEAFRQLFVENALNGLVGLFRFNIHAVDPTELLQLMDYRLSNKDALRVGTFARVRPYPYKGDLAQVVELTDDGKRATVKVVPREDFVDKTYHKVTLRLPQKFFDANIAVGARTDGVTYRWGDLMFDKDGYLLKSVSIRNLMFGDQMVNPSTEELAQFLKGNREQITVASHGMRPSSMSGSASEFKLGEVVRVVAGQLKNAVGTIVDLTISTNTVKIACRVPGRPAPLEIRAELSNCIRHFVKGNQIGVERGPYEGRFGTVIQSNMQTGLLAVLGEGDNEEFEVHAADCRQGRLVERTKHSLGLWRLFDLVLLVDGQTMGCVVRCTTKDMVLVTEKNLTKVVTPTEVKCVARSSRSAIDCMKNVIRRGSEVIIKSETRNVPSKIVGTSATVLQCFNETVFVRFVNLYDNSGVVAVEASTTQLVGGKTTTVTVAQPRQLPLVEKKGHYASKPTEKFEVDDPTTSVEWQSAYYGDEPELQNFV